MKKISLHLLETPQAMIEIEEIQRQIWPGSDRDIVPDHMLLAAVHNGGLVIGAYEINTPIEAVDEQRSANFDPPDIACAAPQAPLVGFVFGFPGLYTTPDGPRPKHCSHLLGVLPAYRDQGIGFLLKRAQWQMVRRQGLDSITWTYDPLISRNAHLNITRLGAVCNKYIRDAYGNMRDELNLGAPSDRFQVDWWVYSMRVNSRLSKRPRPPLDLSHFLSAGTAIINPPHLGSDKLIRPAETVYPDQFYDRSMLLLEVPADFMALKAVHLELAVEWRMHTRRLFEDLFQHGFLVTDYIYLPGKNPRSFYVLSNGERTL